MRQMSVEFSGGWSSTPRWSISYRGLGDAHSQMPIWLLLLFQPTRLFPSCKSDLKALSTCNPELTHLMERGVIQVNGFKLIESLLL